MFDIFVISNRNYFPNIDDLKNHYPFVKTASSIIDAQRKSLTSMFWIIWDDLKILPTFNFNYTVQDWDRQYVHIFKNLKDRNHRVSLVPKNIVISEKENKFGFFFNNKEIDIVASKEIIYDKFVIETYDDYEKALANSKTEMFWGIWNNIDIFDESIYETYFDPNLGIFDYDRNENHVWKNSYNNVSSYVNGLVLFSKNKPVSRKEIENKTLINRKEYDSVMSMSSYPRFKIQTYDDYQNALHESKSILFWGIWNNIEVLDESIFDLYFSPFNGEYDYDRNENHVWKNSYNNVSSYVNGLVLFSKNKPVSRKEIENKTLINRKEYDSVMSMSSYPQYKISNYDDYLNAIQDCNNEMFWGIWDNIEVLDESIFNLYFNPFTGEYDYDRNENHVWLSYCGNETSFGNGLVLFSKNKPVSKKEIEHKTLINRKEHNTIVARARYPKHFINTYEEYLQVRNQCTNSLFWCIWNEIVITDETIFDTFFDPFNGIYDFDRNTNHVFKNKDVEEHKYNGLMLMSRNKLVPKREIDFRFLVDKKEHNRVVSKLKPYDIVFISYNEPNSEKNYQRLLDKNLENKIFRVHGVKGIHNAHLAAAKLVSTPMFFVVDGDAIVNDNFNFEHLVPRYDRYIVHVWNSENPINGLVYGYGGVKLLPTKQTLDLDVNSVDMTSSISTGFRVMPEVSNITEFNTDEFSTWRSAFRECVKLSSKIILGQVDEETEIRLNAWIENTSNAAFADTARLGAKAGKEYGIKNASDSDALGKINDFEWIKYQFEQSLAPLETL